VIVNILVIADNKAEADYWISQLEMVNAVFLPREENTLGINRRTTTIVAVGPCRLGSTLDMIRDLRMRGYSVEYLQETA
jgi:hypothetical protein